MAREHVLSDTEKAHKEAVDISDKAWQCAKPKLAVCYVLILLICLLTIGGIVHYTRRDTKKATL